MKTSLPKHGWNRNTTPVQRGIKLLGFSLASIGGRRGPGRGGALGLLPLTSLLVVLGVFLALSASIVLAADAPPVVLEAERGWHHKLWQRLTPITRRDGTPGFQTNSYTELATGLHYIKDGQWAESREDIEIVNGAALARQGQHQAAFAANLSTPGAIILSLPGGAVLRSHPVGLFYTDAASGQSAVIATVQPSAGAILPPNQVVYPDALAGSCVGDFHYRYTKFGFEQDLLILAAPPSPALYGLNPETTRLELVTEFLDPPQPAITRLVLKPEPDPVRRRQMAAPDLFDDLLDFGTMKFVTGQAFPVGAADPFDGPNVPTGKEWQVLNNRYYLVERVDYRDLRAHLQTLPPAAAVNPNRQIVLPANGQSALARLLPPPPRGERGVWRADQWAKAAPPRRGLVLDYATINSTQTNYVFESDKTYFISGICTLNETTVLEAAVIKFTNGASSASIKITGPLVCRTSQFRPAHLVGKDDNTIGEIIAGSTGNPNTNSYGHYLDLSSNTNTIDLHDVHLRHAYWGLYLSGAWDVAVRHAQIGAAYAALVNTSGKLKLRNVLIHDAAYALAGTGVTNGNQGEHVTFHRVKNLRSSNTGTTALTNCLLISVTNNLYYTGTNVVFDTNDTGYFQTVGAGAHYLANGSTNRSTGTTNINPTLLNDLKKRTTYPPTVLTADITNWTVLNVSPQTLRDDDGFPDLGYHYDPLDYVAHQITVATNATLIMNPGTALGTYGAFGEAGLWLRSGSRIVCEGEPANLNKIVRYNMVQEQSGTNWASLTRGYSLKATNDTSTTLPDAVARFRFTQWSAAGDSDGHALAEARNPAWSLQDCQFHGGKLIFYQPNVAFTNCLFERTYLDSSFLSNPYTLVLRNCTFFGGLLTPEANDQYTCDFKDNLFDATLLIQDVDFQSDYNAYVTNQSRFSEDGAHDVILTASPAYETGPLGRFYLPAAGAATNLVNAGSTTADLLGLYHYTTVTNQVKQTNSMVDIGFHYVAVDANGMPLDADGDGVPDYLEDTDGNGAQGATESHWQIADIDWNNDGIYDSSPSSLSPTTLMRLGYWRFNTNLSGSFPGEKGETPLGASDVSTNASWSRTSVHYIITNSCLRYRETELTSLKTNVNINCRNGTVRFWYKPDWTSANAGGNGPSNQCSFLELGKYTDQCWPGMWNLVSASNGNSLFFTTQSDGFHAPYLAAPWSLVSNHWYQIALTYSPSNVALYLNGQIMTNTLIAGGADRPRAAFTGIPLNNVGGGLAYCPPASERLLGFFLGCDHAVGNQIRGDLEELETFNYPLTAQEIARDFPLFPGATNDVMVDTDYDGRSDLLEEFVDRGFTASPYYVAPCRLGYWRFNEAATNLLSEQGASPLLATNISVAPGWSGNALVFTNSYSALIYRDVETSGWANVNCREGSVSFWFKPQWNSGTGPGGNGYFFYLGTGNIESGSWALLVDPNGSYVRLESYSLGAGGQLLNGSVSFSSNRWTLVTLIYCSTGSALYTNAVLCASGGGVTNYPVLSDRTNGLVLGNTLLGQSPLLGALDELETFNYQLTESEIVRKFDVVHSIDSDLNGIPDILEDLTLTNSTPFLGFPIAVTGCIEAEQFDQGGKGVAYTNVADNFWTNDYRASQIEITNCTDRGGGYCVNNLRSNEWLNYTIDVRVGMTYAVEPRVAPIGTNVGGVFRIEFYTNNGGLITNTGPLTIISNNWADLTARMLYLPAGTNVMKLVMLTNAPGTNVVGKLNYISVYPSWNEGVENITCTNIVTGLSNNVNTWKAATNNAAKIQQAIDSLPANTGGCVVIPAGTYYVAQQTPVETNAAFKNAAIAVVRNDLEIRGSNKTDTVLVAFNRSATIFYLGVKYAQTNSDFTAVTNFVLRDLTLEGRPHLVAETNSDSGGFTNRDEHGALCCGGTSTGTLVGLQGGFGNVCNVMFTNCLFRDPPNDAIIADISVSNVVVRNCDFIFRDGANGAFPFPRWVTTTNTPTTGPDPGGGVGFFARGYCFNLNVLDSMFNGNIELTTLNTNCDTDVACGIVWFQGGGNHFAARNAVTNVGTEGAQFSGGPVAAVGNVFENYSSGPATALSTFTGSDIVAASGATTGPDFSYCLVGNAINGVRSGRLGQGPAGSGPDISSRVHFCGNSLNLRPARNDCVDFYGASLAGAWIEFLNFSGNTLLAGEQGLSVWNQHTNSLILKNDFAAASQRGIEYVGTNGTLHNVIIARNIISQGLSYHLRLRSEEGPRFFLIQNQFRATGSTNNITPFLDPAASPVHFFY